MALSHPKLHEVIRSDFLDYAGLYLRSATACIWCLGASQVGAEEAAYKRAVGGRCHVHFDRRYASIAFGRRCREAGVQPSMGTAGDCYDNAMCESFIGTLKAELLDCERFGTHERARRRIFWHLESW